jgi:hypothetical protein
MASRKEEKERLRQERVAAQQRESQAARQRLMIGYGVAGLLAAAVVVGLVIVIASSGGGSGAGDQPENAHIDEVSGIVPSGVEPDDREGTTPPEIQQADLQTAAKDAGCDLQTDLRDEGNNHVKGGLAYSKYGTNPPTSGDHDPNPLADGAYASEPPVGNFVHSMEHGRIEIQYSPDLPEDDQLALKGVLDEDPDGMLLFPNEQMPYEVAATAWTQLLGCEKYEGDKTLDAIRDFRDTYRGNGPEPIPL